MKQYLDKEYYIFADNCYNSVTLAKYISRQKPTPLVPWGQTDNRGMVFQSLNDISMINWKYKTDVHVITNAFIPEFAESINRHWKSKQKPNVVHIYKCSHNTLSWRKPLGGTKSRNSQYGNCHAKCHLSLQEEQISSFYLRNETYYKLFWHRRLKECKGKLAFHS